MTKTDKTPSYGLYLQSVRVKKGLSIERVAAETRIRGEILRAIEAEDYEKLPGDVFVKGFLQSFARAIDADTEEVLKRFERRRQNLTPEPVGSEASTPQGRRFWLTVLWVTALMIILVGGTLLTYPLFDTQYTETAPQAPHDDNTREVIPPDHEVAKTEPAGVQTVAPEETGVSPREKTEKQPRSYRLEIIAHEETWLKVIADEARATEHILKPEETLQLEADTMFNVLIGNAGGVTVQLNDKPVPVQGRTGQVVNLQLP